MKFTILLSSLCLVSTSQAMKCTTTCQVSYPQDYGWIEKDAKSCNDAVNAAASECRSLHDGAGAESSCVPLAGGGERASQRCFGTSSDAETSKIEADNSQDAWQKAQELCKSWCDAYPKTSFGTNRCEAHGGACVP